MAKNKKVRKSPLHNASFYGIPGHPPSDIEWDIVDRLIEAGNDGVNVAAYFGIHPETLYRRCQEEQNIGFAKYSRERRRKGDSMLLAVQYEKALMDRDNGMLVWLGKNRLEQSDNPKGASGFNGKLAGFLDSLKKIKKSSEFNEDSDDN